MFPTYRPHPHWSTLMGRSHGQFYQMWQEGFNASQAVSKFAEDEDAEFLEMETGQGYNNVLDIFTAPAVDKSAGQTSTVFMVDGLRSKVSFMMKIVPSPDWFIGLSGLDLCHKGRWKRRVQLDLHPFDAGTDQGLTFTSPNWPNEPQEPIFAITSSSPSHPAGSFFYPDYKKLPRLGYLTIELVSEYRLRRTIMEVQEVRTTTTTTTTTKPVSSGEEFLLAVTSNSKKGRDTTSSKDSKINKELKTSNSEKRMVPMLMQSQGIPNEEGLISKPMPRMRSFESKRMKKPDGANGTGNRTLKNKMKKSPAPSKETKSGGQLNVDCIVAEWADWSPCSKTCGFGSRQRLREVIQMPANRGVSCPLLTQNSMCGSMRTCKWSHFSIMNQKTLGSSFGGRRLKRRRRKRT